MCRAGHRVEYSYLSRGLIFDSLCVDVCLIVIWTGRIGSAVRKQINHQTGCPTLYVFNRGTVCQNSEITCEYIQYRVTIQVVKNLTSKQRLRTWAIY